MLDAAAHAKSVGVTAALAVDNNTTSGPAAAKIAVTSLPGEQAAALKAPAANCCTLLAAYLISPWHPADVMVHTHCTLLLIFLQQELSALIGDWHKLAPTATTMPVAWAPTPATAALFQLGPASLCTRDPAYGMTL